VPQAFGTAETAAYVETLRVKGVASDVVALPVVVAVVAVVIVVVGSYRVRWRWVWVWMWMRERIVVAVVVKVASGNVQTEPAGSLIGCRALVRERVLSSRLLCSGCCCSHLRKSLLSLREEVLQHHLSQGNAGCVECVL